MAPKPTAVRARARAGRKAAPQPSLTGRLQKLEAAHERLVRHHGELIALQRDTLAQLANTLERVSRLEDRLRRGPLSALDRMLRLNGHWPASRDRHMVRAMVFGTWYLRLMRWWRALRKQPDSDLRSHFVDEVGG